MLKLSDVGTTALDWLKRQKPSSADAQALQAKLALATAYRDVFSHPAAGVVLRDLVDKSGLLEPHPLGPEGERAEGARTLMLNIVHALGWSEMELAQVAHDRAADAIARGIPTDDDNEEDTV